MTTTTMPDTAAGADLVAHLDALSALVAGGHTVVSQARCVDALLDCYNGSTVPAVRAEVTDFLARIAKLTLVEVAEVRAAMTAISVASEVESAFEHFVIGA